MISGISITNNTVNFIGTPEFGALSAGLLSIARQFPEAKAHIVALLRQLDSNRPFPSRTEPGSRCLSKEHYNERLLQHRRRTWIMIGTRSPGRSNCHRMATGRPGSF